MQSYLFQNYLDKLNKNIFLLHKNNKIGGSKKITYNPYVQLIGGDPTQSKVIDLTTDNFLSKLMEHKNLIVMFSVDWCGHCQKLKPTFEKAANENSNSSIQYAKVDCEKEKNLAEMFNINGFPQVKKISVNDFKINDFNDERTIENIQKFANF